MLIRLATCCLLAWGAFAPARAADSFDGCSAYITQVPISIHTPGVYCLKGNLAVPPVDDPNAGMDSAIQVDSDRVTIDCKGFGIDGRGSGASDSLGIGMGGHRDVGVRNCALTGFTVGILLMDSHGGNVVEDNRLRGMRNQAIEVYGDGSVIRRNIILDTNDPRPAGSGTSASAISAVGSVDITDNLIAGVSANGPVVGISTNGSAATVARNRIRGLDERNSLGYAFGIYVGQSFQPGSNGPVEPRITIRDNDIGINVYSQGSQAVYCIAQPSLITGNVIKGFQLATPGCARAAGNDISDPVPY